MTEVLQANIFFFITGIAVIVFTALLCVALYHLIRILKSVRRVMDRIESGSEVIASDMEKFREYFLERSVFSRILGGILGERSERTHGAKKHAPANSKSSNRPHARTELKIKGEE
jgi:hypothetical protein